MSQSSLICLLCDLCLLRCAPFCCLLLSGSVQVVQIHVHCVLLLENYVSRPATRTNARLFAGWQLITVTQNSKIKQQLPDKINTTTPKQLAVAGAEGHGRCLQGAQVEQHQRAARQEARHTHQAHGLATKA
jgi:hypothetical protein